MSLINLDETFLPIGQMRQITSVTVFEGGAIECEMALPSTYWPFPVHFPDDPILPGSLIIEAAGQVTALWAWANGQRGKPRMVKTTAEFWAPAGPEDVKLVFKAMVKRKQNMNFGSVSVLRNGEEIAKVENCIVVVKE